MVYWPFHYLGAASSDDSSDVLQTNTDEKGTRRSLPSSGFCF